jgi:hypothetical protein
MKDTEDRLRRSITKAEHKLEELRLRQAIAALDHKLEVLAKFRAIISEWKPNSEEASAPSADANLH